MNRIEAAAVARWQLQNETIPDIPDEVCEKTIQTLQEDGWESRQCKFSVNSEERATFDPRHFAWALRVGKIAVGDEVAPWSFERSDGSVCHGIAVWRRVAAPEDDSIEAQTVVE